MRKALVFLTFSLFFTFTSASAAIQAPADLKGEWSFNANNSDKFDVKLEWQNKGQYDSLNITRSSADDPLWSQLLKWLDPTSQVFTDTNSGQGLPSGAYHYNLQAMKGSESETASADVPIPTPEDSPIYIVNTSGGIILPPEYTFICRPTGTTEILVSWAGSSLRAHTLEVIGGENSTGLASLISGKPSGSGSYGHVELKPKTEYFYQLKINYTDSKTPANELTPAIPVSCTTNPVSTPASATLNTWALTPNSIYVNWKDTATQAHTFTLQRMKITPRDESFTGEKVKMKGETSLTLYWTNLTNENQFKSPFKHVIERSTNTINPFADRDADGKFDSKKGVSEDASFTRIERVFTDDDMRMNGTKIAYTTDDTGLTEGTAYVYRLKACSLIIVNLVKVGPPEYREVCSNNYSGIAKQATKPAAPSGFQKTDVTANSVLLSWRDNSGGEDGFELVRDGTVVRTLNALAGRGGTVTYPDTGLSPDRTYVYKVRAYKFNPNYPYIFLHAIWSDFSTITVTTPTSSLPSIKEPSSRFTASLNDIMARTGAGVLSAIERVHAWGSGFGKSVRILTEKIWNTASSWFNVTLAGYENEDYFKQFQKTSDETQDSKFENSLKWSVFEDTGLEADTVYLYRVRMCRGATCDPWMSESAARTLPVGATAGVGTTKVGICTRNSLCEKKTMYSVGIITSQTQCVTNGDCTEVGTSRQFFEETR